MSHSQIRLLNLSLFLASNEWTLFSKCWTQVLLPNFTPLNLSCYLASDAMRPSFFLSDGNMSHSQILGFSIGALCLLAMKPSFLHSAEHMHPTSRLCPNTKQWTTLLLVLSVYFLLTVPFLITHLWHFWLFYLDFAASHCFTLAVNCGEHFQ